MRLGAVKLREYPPLARMEVSGLSPELVVFGGPNGSGKTRLISAIVGLASQHHLFANLELEIHATNKEEESKWGKGILNTADGGDRQKFIQAVQRSQKRGSWKGSIVYFDAQRRFSQANQMGRYTFGDPLDEEIPGNLMAGLVENRHRDTTNAMVRLVVHDAIYQRNRMRILQGEGKHEMPIDTKDPLERFKDIFSTLLGPKCLADIDPTDLGYGNGVPEPELFYHLAKNGGGGRLPLNTLSAGQVEVVLMAFDLMVHNPRDCIVFVDEPELHLHPELSTRLFQALKKIGSNNQFVVGTHSPDLISQGLGKSLVFLSPDTGAGNQGVVVKPGDENIGILRQLGENLGVISLGRNIVLIEGTDGSLDRATYTSVLEGRFPEFALSPSTSRDRMVAFESITRDVLDKTMWGIRFFMIGDRDNSLSSEQLASLETESRGKLRFLKRYHLENYFLDESTIARAFEDMVAPENWLREPAKIRGVLRECASETLPYAMQIWANTFLRGRTHHTWPDLKLNGARNFEAFKPAITKAAEFLPSTVPTVAEVVSAVEAKWKDVGASIEADTDLWKSALPGKPILGMFSTRANLDRDRLCRLYVKADTSAEVSAFQDILDIFESFRSQITPSK